MSQVAKFMIGFAFILLLAGCETDAPVSSGQTDQIQSHGTAMGFTPWPADLTENGVERTYSFIGAHANLVSHHFDGGIPWEEALRGTPFPEHLERDWNDRKRRTPAGFQTFVSVTPLNFERDGLALSWTNEGDNRPLSKPWSSMSLDSQEVKLAYSQYVERVIAHFNPDYLAIGIEANIMVSKVPERWSSYLALNAYVYDHIKAKHPDLPVFTTIQYDHLRAIEDDAKQNADRQIPSVTALMDHSDLLALSTYRFGHFHPNPMSPRFFEIAESFGKPLAIAEFGAMSSPVNIFGTRLPADEADQSRFVSGLLALAIEKEFHFVVNWVAVDFDPMIRKLPSPMDEVAKAWVHTGLQTSGGKNKPALVVWDNYLEASLCEAQC